MSWLRRLTAVPQIVQDNFGLITPRYYFGNRVRRRDDQARADETVLLIHGYFQTRGSMDSLEQRLRADGYRPISFDLGGFLGNFNTTSIRRLARRIDQKVQSLRADEQLSGTMQIVGHSMGGLVARHLVGSFSVGAVTTRVITLGSPHHGTPLAAVGAALPMGVLGAAVWQMVPGSRFIRELNETPLPDHIELTSIYSRTDLLAPASAARLGGPSMRNQVVSGLGHMELVEDPWVYGLVLRELQRPSTSPG